MISTRYNVSRNSFRIAPLCRNVTPTCGKGLLNLMYFPYCFSLSEFSYISVIHCHVKWVPCHHGMARPQVAVGGEGLQIWRVAASILNKQSRTADKGWPSSLGGWAGC
jgi:hypothetical protein